MTTHIPYVPPRTLLDRLQRIERQIIDRLVHDAISGGYKLTVNDGEEATLIESDNVPAIMKALFTTDEDYLIYFKDGKRIGWVWLIHGNGVDVISDCSIGLEATGILKDAEKLANELDA